MRAPTSSQHVRACFWLVAATVLWGVSFPLTKAILAKQQLMLPGSPTPFFAALLAVVRFGIAGIVVILVAARSLRQLTGCEIRQGLGLAFFGGIGILLQIDGLAYTSASVSAFLTQFYCLLIPIWVICRTRALPTFAVVVSSILVLAGAAILADVRWGDFRVGRGEAETLLAAMFFAGQILWLERPEFAANRTSHFTLVMFFGTSLLATPIALYYAPSLKVWVTAYSDISLLILLLGLVVFCTLGSYGLMNAWQKHITATEAGLIYCVEPVAAFGFALFLPQWLSVLAAINYPNERITSNLLIGGSFILAANVLIQIEAARRARRVFRSIESQRV
ncbi:MAG: EamA family transporter [Verrucomicrobia subdivision 3 bacterium]|nr:EamA family transporter [Limisphaerales bacterium]